MALLPQPTKNARIAYDVLTGIISALVPPAAALKPIVDAYLERRMQLAQDMLFRAIADQGIGALSDEQFEFYVPAIYRFLEQVRVGEYEHNLKVLAGLIARRLNDESENPDVGAVARAARRLEMISIGELQTLAASKIAWDQLVINGPGLYSEMHLEPKAILEAHDTIGVRVSFSNLNERLHELDVRGILRYSPPSGFFHGGYAPTRAYFEIIDAVADAIGNDGRPSPSNEP